MTLLLSTSPCKLPFSIPYCEENFWWLGERWVQQRVWSPRALQSVKFFPSSFTISWSSSGSQNTQKELEKPWEWFRGRTSERTHWAVIDPRMDSVLALAETLILSPPLFKSTSTVSEWPLCSHVPHIIKSRSPSVAAQEKTNKNTQREKMIYHTVI